MHVTRYIGNVKGQIEHKIGQKTLIVGPNGSSKSAICQGIQLALTGTCDEIMYRDDVATEDRLILLAPAGAPLQAQVHLSDGTKASCQIKRKEKGVGKKALSDVLFDRDKVFPFARFRRALLGSDAALQNFLISRVTRDAKEADIIARIPDVLHESYVKLAAGAPESDVITGLLHVSKESKKRGRELKAQADGADQAALAAARGLAAPSDVEIEAARKAFATAQAQQQQQIAWSMGAAARKVIEGAEAAVTSLRAEESTLTAQVAATEMLSEETKAALTNVLWHSKRKDCLVCGPDAPCASVFAHLKAERIKKAQAKLNASADTAVVQERLSEIQAAIAREEDRSATARSVSGALGKPPIDAAAIRAGLLSTEKKLRELTEARGMLSAAQKSRDEAVRLRQRADNYNLLHDECEKTIKLILLAGCQQFEAEVQKWLPTSDVFKLDLPHFGLMRGVNFCVPVSGSEMVKLGASITAACKEQELTVYIGEDVGWDSHHLGEAMIALKEVPIQVILQSTVLPYRTIGGWTVIETGEGLAAELM